MEWGGESRVLQVLLVDDDEFGRTHMRDLLAGDGFEVVDLASGEAALRYLESARPAVIVLDVMMSPLTGFDILRELRLRHEAPPPVVMVSGAGALGGETRARLGGAKGYLSKDSLRHPLTGLCARVRQVLDV